MDRSAKEIMNNWKGDAKNLLFTLINETYKELVDERGRSLYPQKPVQLNELSEDAQTIFAAFDNIIDQLKKADRKKLSETELNTLYNYIYKALLPEYQRLAHGRVMERK